jgi:hypothetical protein
MRTEWLIGLFLSGLALPGCAAAESAREYIDPDTGLAAWEWQGDGIKAQQIQRIPDQTRAFFQGRDFSREDADHIAAACVFQTLFYNQGQQTLHLDLAEWRARVGNGWKPLILTSDWQRDWEARGSPQSARIAFQWALFPNVQEFAPGDWNMGMVTYPVAHGGSFDLRLAWHVGGSRHEALLKGLRCAEDKTYKTGGESP